ncbi:MAG: hflX [Gammaproteobacteria bacterium]|nr:hflX [Gammaproteobacteria bacterium]
MVHIDFRNPQFNEEFDEFIQLAGSSGLSILTTITGTRDIPNAKYFAGTGKVEEIRRAVADMAADVVVFNHALTPGQERNLEAAIGCRVIDRVGLILDIYCNTCPPGWYGAGRIWNGRKAVLVCVVPAKPNWKRIDV